MKSKPSNRRKPTVKKRLSALFASALLVGGIGLAGAAPAAAATQYGGIPPQKSWICSTFNICKTTWWCVPDKYSGAYLPKNCYPVRH